MIDPPKYLLEDQISARQQTFAIRSALLVLSLIISLLYGMHHILLLYDLKDDDRQTIFITSFKTYDANHYLAQLKDVYEGHYRMSNVFLAEHKETARPFWPAFPFYLAGFLGKALHIKVQHLAVLMDFMLPPIVFLLCYAVHMAVSQRHKAAIFGALVSVLYPHLPLFSVLNEFGAAVVRLTNSWNMTEMLPALWYAHAYHDGFARPINPQLTFPFLLAALLFFVKYLYTFRWWNLGLSIGFGVMVSYSYVYFASYLYAFWGTFILLGLLLRLFQSWLTQPTRENDHLRGAAIALGMTLLCSIPFWLSAFRFSDTSLRQATLMSRTHAPILTPEVYVAMFVCIGIGLLMRFGVIRQLPGLCMLALLLSAVIALNQRVITGLEIQSWHYQVHVLPQAMILVISLLWAELLHARRNRGKGIVISLTILMICGGIGVLLVSILANPGIVAAYLSSDGELSAISRTLLLGGRMLTGGTGGALLICGLWRVWRSRPRVYLRVGTLFYGIAFLPLIAGVGVVQYHLYYGDLKPRLGYMQELAPALHWLNTHTDPESVVLIGLNYASEHTTIPIYTRNNLYTAPLMTCYPVPSEPELRDRIYNVLAFMRITTREDFDRTIRGEHQKVRVTFEEYQQKLSKDLHSELTTYRVDYVLYGPRERAGFRIDPAQYPFLQEIYRDAAVTIYSLVH